MRKSIAAVVLFLSLAPTAGCDSSGSGHRSAAAEMLRQQRPHGDPAARSASRHNRHSSSHALWMSEGDDDP